MIKIRFLCVEDGSWIDLPFDQSCSVELQFLQHATQAASLEQEQALFSFPAATASSRELRFESRPPSSSSSSAVDPSGCWVFVLVFAGLTDRSIEFRRGGRKIRVAEDGRPDEQLVRVFAGLGQGPKQVVERAGVPRVPPGGGQGRARHGGLPRR